MPSAAKDRDRDRGRKNERKHRGFSTIVCCTAKHAQLTKEGTHFARSRMFGDACQAAMRPGNRTRIVHNHHAPSTLRIFRIFLCKRRFCVQWPPIQHLSELFCQIARSDKSVWSYMLIGPHHNIVPGTGVGIPRNSYRPGFVTRLKRPSSLVQIVPGARTRSTDYSVNFKDLVP